MVIRESGQWIYHYRTAQLADGVATTFRITPVSVDVDGAHEDVTFALVRLPDSPSFDVEFNDETGWFAFSEN